LLRLTASVTKPPISMSNIHLTEPGGQPVAYPEEQAQALWSQGRLTSQTLYWREGMSEWRPVAELFGGPPPLFSSPPPLPRVSRWAKNPATLTRLLRIMLWVYLGMVILSALMSVASLATGRAAQVEIEELGLMEIVEVLVALAYLGVYVTTVVVFAMWIHRANRNARALGATHLHFTPGWAVGWYFIPIFHLWKPMQAMREIWHASRNPHAAPSDETPGIIGGWWGLWLLTNLLGQLSLRYTLSADTSRAMVVSEIISLISDCVDVGLCLVAGKLVTQIYHMQKAHAEA
jgi:hypothetical protein